MSTLSDFNAPNYRSKKVASEKIFSDLNLSLPIHPNKKDIVPLTDIDAVKQSVKNLVLTNYGEKLFKPKFGGNITSYLFENVTRFTAVSIFNEIRRILAKHEPRITDVKVQVTDNADANEYNVTVGFRVINNPELLEVGFALQRIR
jgi:phage baseplate assembly protein W